MRVDLPAPFSPMSECTSPGSSRKPTSSSAFTPGNSTEMPCISTIGVSVIAILFLNWSPAPRCWWAGGSDAARPPRAWSRSELAVGQSGACCLRRIERLAGNDDVGINFLARQSLVHRVQCRFAEERVVLSNEAYVAVRKRFEGVLGAVDRGNLDVLTRGEAGFLDRLHSAQSHLVVLSEDELDIIVLRLEHRLENALRFLGGPVGGLGVDLNQFGVLVHHLIEALVAFVDNGYTGRALKGHVVRAIWEGLHCPIRDRGGDLDVIRSNPSDVQARVVGLDPTIDEDNRDLGLLRPLEGRLPTRAFRRREQDQVDPFVNERRERVDLRLLVKVRRGRELEFESRFLGERILNVLFIRLRPRALGTAADETDGRQITPAPFAALAACPFRIAAATRAEPKGQDAHADQAIEPTKPLRRCHVYSSLRYFGHLGRASRTRALPPALPPPLCAVTTPSASRSLRIVTLLLPLSRFAPVSGAEPGGASEVSPLPQPWCRRGFPNDERRLDEVPSTRGCPFDRRNEKRENQFS